MNQLRRMELGKEKRKSQLLLFSVQIVAKRWAQAGNGKGKGKF